MSKIFAINSFVRDYFDGSINSIANIARIADQPIIALPSMEDLSHQGKEYITHTFHTIKNYSIHWTILNDTSVIQDQFIKMTNVYTIVHLQVQSIYYSITVGNAQQYIVEPMTKKASEFNIYHTITDIYDTSDTMSTLFINAMTTNEQISKATLYVVDTSTKALNAIKDNGITGHLLLDTPLMLVLAFYVFMARIAFTATYRVCGTIKTCVHVVLHVILLGLSIMALPVLLIMN